MSNDEITGMYELLDALEETLQVADPNKREVLAKTLDAYQDDFPDEFHWAIGAQAPTLLSHLMMSIAFACRSNERPGRFVRLINRRPEGNA
jgi:hypothetical protein